MLCTTLTAGAVADLYLFPVDRGVGGLRHELTIIHFVFQTTGQHF